MTHADRRWNTQGWTVYTERIDTMDTWTGHSARISDIGFMSGFWLIRWVMTSASGCAQRRSILAIGLKLAGVGDDTSDHACWYILDARFVI